MYSWNTTLEIHAGLYSSAGVKKLTLFHANIDREKISVFKSHVIDPWVLKLARCRDKNLNAARISVRIFPVHNTIAKIIIIQLSKSAHPIRLSS